MPIPANLGSAVARHLSWKELDLTEATRLHLWKGRLGQDEVVSERFGRRRRPSSWIIGWLSSGLGRERFDGSGLPGFAGSPPYRSGVALAGGAGTAGTFVCASCMVFSDEFEINETLASALAFSASFSAPSRLASCCLKILSITW